MHIANHHLHGSGERNGKQRRINEKKVSYDKSIEAAAVGKKVRHGVNSEEINPIALAKIKLHLSVENKFLN